MSRMMRASALAVAVSITLGTMAFGGEVVFKNGDRLTGKVTQLDGGKLVIESAVAGKVTVDIGNVATFSTDEPVEIQLKDGSTLKQQVAPAEAGQIATSGGAVAPQTVPLEQVAAINPPKPEIKWTGSIRAGAEFARGNTDTDQVNIEADAVRRGIDDRILLAGQYLLGRTEDPDTGEKQTTTDNWTASAKYDYFLSKKLYFFGLVKAERDNIADLELRLSPSVGLGYQWVEGPVWNFNTEAGLGWVYESFEDDQDNEYVAARFAYHYDRVLRENVKFVHNFEYLPSVEDPSEFNLNADAGVRVAMSDQLFLEFKVQVKHDSEPAEDAEKTDVRYIANVGWNF